MKVEPGIDQDALVAHLQQLYGLRVDGLQFVPEGECSSAYVVHCAGGQRYFLKLWGDDRQGRKTRAALDVFLPLTRELYERGFLTCLCPALPAVNGSLHAVYADRALALFPYAAGRSLLDFPGPLPASVRERIAGAYARLHSATQLVGSRLPSRPAFFMDFSADLRRSLAALDAPQARNPGGQARLRALLLPRRAELLHHLAGLERLRPQVQARAGELVLCHTDMGGNNVLVQEDGQVIILDWDELILAPAEHDLQEYRGEGFADFIRRYRQAGGAARLDALQFAFYLKRRYLADLTDWLVRILEENNDPRQDEADLSGIETYCLAFLDRFEAEMEGIREALASASLPH